MTSDAHHQSVPPLDERLYKLDRAFFKQQTGIEDDHELKTHLLSIQAEAFEVSFFFSLRGPFLIQSRKVYSYPCIRYFSWARYGHTIEQCTIVFELTFHIYQACDLASLRLPGLVETWPAARGCDPPGYWLLL
jgi:hypothetical protein